MSVLSALPVSAAFCFLSTTSVSALVFFVSVVFWSLAVFTASAIPSLLSDEPVPALEVFLDIEAAMTDLKSDDLLLVLLLFEAVPEEVFLTAPAPITAELTILFTSFPDISVSALFTYNTHSILYM